MQRPAAALPHAPPRTQAACRDVVVPITLSSGVASGAVAIKRLDFKIGDGEWADTSMVANDVTVKFKLAFSGL